MIALSRVQLISHQYRDAEHTLRIAEKSAEKWSLPKAYLADVFLHQGNTAMAYSLARDAKKNVIHPILEY
ncbi:hypothetical protein ACSLBF_06980 [Pseudoalteromonas sp. T1lg65]|uniref:hypothetical protein n=1 Tax=Pseudoalteromonas sp. T1lg65 TaxID=2077101 RepID=UPI003F79B921